MEKFSDLLTIAIPVYERCDFLEEAVNSALNQTVKCKIIVIDNCSSHNKFKEYVEKLNNDNVSYHKNAVNVGMTNNCNVCIELSTTPWVTILHDDDLLYPNYVYCFEQVRLKYPDVALISSGWEWNYFPNSARLNQTTVIDTIKTREFKTEEFAYEILSAFPGIAINKAICTITFNDQYYPIHDFDYWVRASKIDKVIKFNSVQAFYRFAEVQASSNYEVVKAILSMAYRYRKENVPIKNYLSKLMSLATTFNSIKGAKERYNQTIKWQLYIAPEDAIYMKAFETRLFLYFVYALKYINRFFTLLKFRTIK